MRSLQDQKLRIAPDLFESSKISAVRGTFRGSGLDVDVVPILYDGDPSWYGKLVSQEDGSFLATCVPPIDVVVVYKVDRLRAEAYIAGLLRRGGEQCERIRRNAELLAS